MSEYWMVERYDPYAIDDEPARTYMFGLEPAVAKSIARHYNKLNDGYIYFAEEEPRRWV